MGLKAELEADIFACIPVVIDLDLIHDRWVKWKIVRSIAGLEKWIDVEDEGDTIWMIVADKCVEIGDVSGMIQRGNGRFSMA